MPPTSRRVKRAVDRRRDRRVADRADRAAARGDAWARPAAASIAASYPPLVWICAYALSEAFFATLALACVWCWTLTGSIRRRTPPRSAGSGAPSQRGEVVVAGHAGGSRRADAAGDAVLFAASRPCCSGVPTRGGRLVAPRSWPWPRAASSRRGPPATSATLRAIRAGRVGGRRDVLDRQPSRGARRRRPGGKPAPQAAQRRVPRARIPDCTEEELEPIYYREALGFIAEASGALGRARREKLFYTVVPIGPSYRLHSPLLFLTSRRCLLRRRCCRWRCGVRRRCWRSPAPWTLLALAASAVLVCLVFFPQERFRIPVIDPIVIVSSPGPALPRCPPAQLGASADRRSATRRPRVICRRCLRRTVRTLNVRPPPPPWTCSSSSRPTTSARTCPCWSAPSWRATATASWWSTISRPTAPAQVADELAAEFPGRVEVLHRTGKRGLGRSYIDALTIARARPAPTHLPDGRGPVARSGVSARHGGRGGRRRTTW